MGSDLNTPSTITDQTDLAVAELVVRMEASSLGELIAARTALQSHVTEASRSVHQLCEKKEVLCRSLRELERWTVKGMLVHTLSVVFGCGERGCSERIEATQSTNLSRP